MEEGYLPEHAPLWAYLKLAEKYYQEDRLDLAMKVVEDSFQDAGWPAGTWTQFYNNLNAEKDARDSSTLHRVDDLLSIELETGTLPIYFEHLRSAALDARHFVRQQLSVELTCRVMVTVFRADAPLPFIQGPYGYVMHKAELEKICLPWVYADPRSNAVTALKHEFVHVAVQELAGENVDKWLNEGLASYLAQDFKYADFRFTTAKEALDQGSVSLEHLEDVFSTSDGSREAITAAYFLSSTFIAWWVEHHGLGTVRETLVRLGQGEAISHAVHHATGSSLHEMERGWISDSATD